MNNEWSFDFGNDIEQSVHLAVLKILLNGLHHKLDSVISSSQSWEVKKRLMEPLLKLTDSQLIGLSDEDYEHESACMCKHNLEEIQINLSCCNQRYHEKCFFKSLKNHETRGPLWGNKHQCTFCKSTDDKHIALCNWNCSSFIIQDLDINGKLNVEYQEDASRITLHNYRPSIAFNNCQVLFQSDDFWRSKDRQGVDLPNEENTVDLTLNQVSNLGQNENVDRSGRRRRRSPDSNVITPNRSQGTGNTPRERRIRRRRSNPLPNYREG